MNYALNFSKSLSKYLHDNRLSQKELSNILNIKQSTLSMWINCKNSPTLQTICNICDTLNLSIYDLLDYNINLSTDFNLLLLNSYYQHPEHQFSINKLLDIEVKNE